MCVSYCCTHRKTKVVEYIWVWLVGLHHPVLQGWIRRSNDWRHERGLVNIVDSNKGQFEWKDYEVCDVKEGTRCVYISCNVALYPGK
jgi:hypothetical protein